MVNSKLDTKKIITYLTLILFAFMAMNFKAKFFYFAFIAVLLFFIFQLKIKIDKIWYLYLALSILTCFYNVDNGVLAMIRCFSYVLIYLLGFNILSTPNESALTIEENKLNKQKQFYYIILALALGSFLHFGLNYVTNISADMDRNTIDIWSGEVMSATGQAALACVMIGFSVALIIKPFKPIYRILGLLIATSILIYNLVLAGRTIFVIYLIVFLVATIYYAVTTKKISLLIKSVLGLLFVGLVFVILYNYNVFGLKNAILDSNFYERFFGRDSMGMTETGRTDAKINYLINFLNYPFGGLNLRAEYGYAHDLLFDAYDEYGLLCLILLIAILICGIKELITYLKNNDNNLTCKICVLCVYVAILLEFCIEPIFAGMQWLFVSFCLINGCLSALNKKV